jgi:antitoxin ParD1/3/4
MAKVEKRNVSLPLEHAAYIDELVASGAYASGSEVVRAGLRALKERNAAVSCWLRDEVAPVYDAMQADRDRAIPLDDVPAQQRALVSPRGIVPSQALGVRQDAAAGQKLPLATTVRAQPSVESCSVGRRQ